MPRPRYTLTARDFQVAKDYLIRQGYSHTPGRGVASLCAPEQLQAWCDDYLPPAAWRRLKSTILQERKRGKDEAACQKSSSITVSARTLAELHRIQNELTASRHRITLDQLIHAMALQFSDKPAAQIRRELEIQPPQ